MDRSHKGEVQCTGIITLACLSFELVPFVVFHTWILSGAYLQNCTSLGYEISWVDRYHRGEVQCTGIITLACLIFELVPFVVFHTWILSGACPSFTTWGKTVVSCDNLPLLFNLCKIYITSTPHNILSKPLVTFPRNHCRNNGQRWERNESCCNDNHQSSERKLAELGTEPVTSDLLFSSPVCYQPSFRAWFVSICRYQITCYK